MKQNDLRYTGIKIKAILETQGRRQDWLAAQAGVSPALITRAIKGERTISRPVAERVASALGVPFFVLFESPVGNDMMPIGSTTDRSVA